ncbi:uncharacterized protein [Parasteatoda tepidariorum]|uniref:uncharacterized protein n=1 Tax=Parasteatoda tepidariorum TaxID=114398 RepID=UPI0039BC9A77
MHDSRISIHKLCKKYDWYCKPYNDEDYCEKYPRYCFPPYKTLNKVKNEDYEDHIKKEKLSWNETFEFSSSAGVVYKCFKIIGQVTFNCSNDVKGVPVTTVENFPAYCFSVGSQIGKPDSRAEFNPNYLNYRFVLNTLQEEYFDLDDPVLIYVGIHDSKQFSNPFNGGVALHGGFKYKAFVTMTEIIRLPSPYNSNCRDYISLWRENSGNGPLTRYVSGKILPNWRL